MPVHARRLKVTAGGARHPRRSHTSNAQRVPRPMQSAAAPKAAGGLGVAERACLGELGVLLCVEGNGSMRSYDHGKLEKLNWLSHSPTAPSAKQAVCWLLMAALVVCAAPGLATVLCISPNGHTAVEALNALCFVIGKPSRSSPQPPPSTLGQLSQSRPCGNCTDVPVIAAADRHPAVSVDSQAAPASPAPVSLSIQCSAAASASQTQMPALSPVSESQAALALGSVSLRC